MRGPAAGDEAQRALLIEGVPPATGEAACKEEGEGWNYLPLPALPSIKSPPPA